MTIHKIRLPITDLIETHLPQGYKILHVGNQGNNLCLWYIFDENEDRKDFVRFQIIGTGHIFDDGKEYVGTVIINAFVWHIFKIK